MQNNLYRQKFLSYLKCHYFSWSSRTSCSWRISKLEKPFPMFFKTLPLYETRPHYLLTTRDFISERPRQPPEHSGAEIPRTSFHCFRSMRENLAVTRAHTRTPCPYSWYGRERGDCKGGERSPPRHVACVAGANSLSLPFQTPATQATRHATWVSLDESEPDFHK